MEKFVSPHAFLPSDILGDFNFPCRDVYPLPVFSKSHPPNMEASSTQMPERKEDDWIERNGEVYFGVDHGKITRIHILLDRLKKGSLTQGERAECEALCQAIVDGLPDFDRKLLTPPY